MTKKDWLKFSGAIAFVAALVWVMLGLWTRQPALDRYAAAYSRAVEAKKRGDWILPGGFDARPQMLRFCADYEDLRESNFAVAFYFVLCVERDAQDLAAQDLVNHAPRAAGKGAR